MTKEEELQILIDFDKKFRSSQVESPPEYTQLVEEHFWELIAND